jgi:mono/diheme cytochrome c family protein
VGVPSIEQPAVERVKPGDPDASYIVLKLEGAASISGARMPFGGPYLSAAQIAQVESWISAGALDN